MQQCPSCENKAMRQDDPWVWICDKCGFKATTDQLTGEESYLPGRLPNVPEQGIGRKRNGTSDKD